LWATGGCVSWYLNAAGRNTTLWPGSTLGFRRATRHLDVSEYHIITPEPAARAQRLVMVEVVPSTWVSLRGRLVTESSCCLP